MREELDKAHSDIKALQEQIANGYLPNRTVDILKRTLQHLERYASNYYSSGVEEEVIELRQLIAEAKCTQVEGVLLESEPPKWEYRWVESDDGLDEIGAGGWGAVLIEGKRILFKRPL